MSKIPEFLRQLIIERSGNRCEYCRLSQIGQAATFHIDHVIPVKVGGKTVADNLALACVTCSLYKAAKQMIPDPETSELVTIFNPRQQRWINHFRWEDVYVIGLTATGRATIDALKMNRATILAIRKEEEFFGRHPPPP